jgi:short subunit dehydrogenase-like uncharacterized protein
MITLPRDARPYDLVLLGATGFTGRLVARSLAAEPGMLRWALAGRDPSRLAEVRSSLAARHPDRPDLARLPLLTADSQDPATLATLAASTRVVCTTVGPYDRLGEPLVAACVAAGTDCCDLTGEVPFMARSVARFDARARETGARIVHGCGFDSIPSDLGSLRLQYLVQQHQGRPAGRIRFALGPTRGGFSGGTVASMMGVAERLAEPGVRRLLADRWALAQVPHAGDGAARPRRRGPPDFFPPRRAPDSGRWQAPFLMAPVNSRVVMRSASLLGEVYGADFSYEEVVDCGAGLRGAVRAAGMTSVLALGGLVLAHPVGRALARRALPAPGEGPSEATMARGFWKARLEAWRSPSPAPGAPPDLGLEVSGEGDPGYASTSRMLAAAALSLALDPPTPAGRSGVLTPALAFGSVDGPIWDRLERAGVRFLLADS